VIVRQLLVAGISMVLALSACSPSVDTGEPEIRYGRDVCTQCGMIASEVKFAASYRLDGQDFLFDDIGDLVIYAREFGVQLDPQRTWVHDFESEESLLAADAFFIPTVSVATPMGHGVIAVSDMATAERIASQLGGEVIRWDVLIALPIENGRVGTQAETLDSD
jgi:copper chaperone NosL